MVFARFGLHLVPFIVLTVLGFPLRVDAFEVEGLCSGMPIDGIRDARAFEVDTCFTAMSGSEFDVLDFGISAWNTVQGMTDMFGLQAGDSDCSTNVSDNAWETALVPKSNPVLDGNSGVVVSLYRACAWPYTGQIYKADLLVDQTLPLGSLPELSTALGARETAIHEFGHVLGAQHEDGKFSVMCTANTCGKVGRRGLTVAGNRSETVLPDDVDFGLTFFDSGKAGNHDPTTSPWEFSSGPKLIYGLSGETRQVCPGDLSTLYYGLGNIGKKSHTSSSKVEVEIVFSTNTTISTSDIPMAVRNVIEVASGEFKKVGTFLLVPSTLTPGVTYHVGVIADPDNDFVEDDEFNNSSETGLRLYIKTNGC